MFRKRKSEPSLLGKAAAVYQAGLAAFEAGRYGEAIETLTTIAEENSLPGTLARFYLGRAHLQEGVSELNAGLYSRAAAHFAEARRINPDSTGLSSYIAACHVGQGRFDLAAAAMEQERACETMDEDLVIRLAHAFVRDCQLPRAVQVLNEAIETSPRRADLRHQLGLLHASVGEYVEAAGQLKAAVELAPLSAEIHQHLAMAMAAMGDARGSIRHLATAQRLRPHDAHTAFLLAMGLKATRSATNPPAEPGAEGESAAGARKPGGGFLALRGGGLHGAVRETASRGDGCYAGAIAPEEEHGLEALGEVLVSEPDFVEAFLSLPQSEVDGEIFSALAATLERALERHPGYADLHYHCSRVYARQGRTDAAIERAASATRINPRYVQALIQLGRLYRQTDQRGEAIDRLREAIELGGDYPDVHVLLGELYQEDGRKTEARAEFRRALELNSGYARAREALMELQSA